MNLFVIVNEGFGATVNVAKPKKGQSVAIFGLGAVGLAVSSYLFFTRRFSFLLSP